MNEFKYRDNNKTMEIQWLTTYSDVLTVLLVFFILLLSVSSVNQLEYEKTLKAIQSGFTKKQDKNKDTFSELQSKLEQERIENEYKISNKFDGLSIEFKSDILFKSGEAILNEKDKKSLLKIANEIQAFGYKNFIVEIEGHSDNRTISSDKFPSNWELSSARASSVARYLIENGVKASLLKVAGYADTKPVIDNSTEENMAKNRRIVINITRVEEKK